VDYHFFGVIFFAISIFAKTQKRMFARSRFKVIKDNARENAEIQKTAPTMSKVIKDHARKNAQTAPTMSISETIKSGRKANSVEQAETSKTQPDGIYTVDPTIKGGGVYCKSNNHIIILSLIISH
jgi:hypothetical protein